MTRRVLLAGYYGRGNVGDDAILVAIHAELLARRPDLRLTVTAGDGALPHGVERVDPRDLPVLAQAVRSSDLVALGGGGLLQDYWPVPSSALLTARQGGLVEYLASPVLAHLQDVPIVLLGIGVGPLTSDEGREQARLALQLAQRATVRDDESLAVAVDLLGADGAAHVSPAADPAFLLRPDLDIEQVLVSAGWTPERPTVGLALRHWPPGVDAPHWLDEVLAGVDAVAGPRDAQVLMLPLDRGGADRTGSDLALAGLVRERRPGVLVLDAGLNPARIAGVLGRCNVVLAMRYHAALLAAGQGTPSACLAYDPKIDHLASQLAGPAALPPSAWNSAEVQRVVEEALDRPREHVRFRAEELRAAARGCIDILLEVLDAPNAPRRSLVTRTLHNLALESSTTLYAAEQQLAERAVLQNLVAARDLQLASVEERRVDLERVSHQQDQELKALGDRIARDAAEQRRLRAQLEEVEASRLVAEQTSRAAEEQVEAASLVRRAAEENFRLVTSSPAYRIAAPAWRVGNKLLPLGSRRRALYHSARRTLTTDSSPAAGGSSWTEAGSRPSPSALDDLSALATFQQQVRAEGSERVVVVLSGTHLREDEGQRPTQLVLQMAAQGTPVVFAYFRWDREERHTTDLRHQGILQLPLDVLLDHSSTVSGLFEGMQRLLLVAFPYPPFFELVARCNAAGWITAYDVLDDWEQFHEVGQAVWYDAPFERHLARGASLVTAINQPLAELVGAPVDREVHVVPNGLRPGLERVYEARVLERGEVTVGYFGHLTAAWFDWEMLAGAAERTPTWRYYVIGYGGGPEFPLPGNVRLLGKQPQTTLASYARNWDVAVVPFRRTRLAECADPIKVYEYLAMGLPVVVSGVHAPLGAEDHVERVSDLEGFLEAVSRAAAAASEQAADERRAYAATCTWGARVTALLKLAADAQPAAVTL